MCGNRSKVLQSTSCLTPPTFITTRLFSAFDLIIMKGSGGSEDIDLQKYAIDFFNKLNNISNDYNNINEGNLSYDDRSIVCRS